VPAWLGLRQAISDLVPTLALQILYAEALRQAFAAQGRPARVVNMAALAARPGSMPQDHDAPLIVLGYMCQFTPCLALDDTGCLHLLGRRVHGVINDRCARRSRADGRPSPSCSRHCGRPAELGVPACAAWRAPGLHGLSPRGWACARPACSPLSTGGRRPAARQLTHHTSLSCLAALQVHAQHRGPVRRNGQPRGSGDFQQVGIAPRLTAADVVYHRQQPRPVLQRPVCRSSSARAGHHVCHHSRGPQVPTTPGDRACRPASSRVRPACPPAPGASPLAPTSPWRTSCTTAGAWPRASRARAPSRPTCRAT
jgi:hypothetical protein